jgi:hypothetical protein
VVAAEVRKLAERSQLAATEISTIASGSVGLFHQELPGPSRPGTPAGPLVFDIELLSIR